MDSDQSMKGLAPFQSNALTGALGCGSGHHSGHPYDVAERVNFWLVTHGRWSFYEVTGFR